MVLARTVKGKGMLDVEDKEGEHGKAMTPDLAARMISVLERSLTGSPDHLEAQFARGGGTQ